MPCDHAEHDRRHDHRDQLQEGIAEDLEADREIGSGHSQHDPQQERRKHLNKQRGVERLARNGRSGGGDGRHRSSPFKPVQSGSNNCASSSAWHSFKTDGTGRF
jgi:hypothetical protein